jgi:CRP-like cAMP-binding protein
LVRHLPLFSEISPEDCATIVAPAQERQLPRGKTLFFQGDPVKQVVLLISGCIKLLQLSADGQEVILRLVGPGESVSAEGCTKCAAHCSTARTLEQSTALVWEGMMFSDLAERFPALRRNVLRELQLRMNQLEDRYLEICTQKVALRLSSELVRLLARVGRGAGGHIEVAISQRELAQLVGTTLFTVSRLLCQWEAKGIVKPGREVVLVLNVPALVEISKSE